MTPFLLLDFGTTSTKSTIVDLDSGHFSRPQSHPSIPNAPAPPGHYEIPLDAIRERFIAICEYYYDELRVRFRGIIVCSEMHGFAVLDDDGNPLSNYISWKDERSLDEIDALSTFDLISEKLGDSFKTITGMKPRPGFPLLNLIHMGRANRLPAHGRVVSLPSWLAMCSGDSQNLDHPTILAGMTFYDVRKNALSAEILDLIRELTGFTCRFDDPAPAGQIAGYWHHDGRKIPLYVGVGDHQCSVLGAGLAADALSINLGTGSQVSILDLEIDDDDVETRPYFDGSTLKAITHLPAGRALNAYIGFLDEIAGGQADFWTMLDELNVDDVLKADMDFNLSIFPGARHYRKGGGIACIREGNFTLHNYLASLLRSFAAQYREIVDIFDPDRHLCRCLLSGGIARNLPLLRDLIARETGYQTLPATDLDESFLGLRTLALVADGRATTCQEALKIFARECRLQNP